jgi:D-alanyl-lipoteichoic acid acyltransferase DltB (MBOAT superfamily)
MSFISFSFVLLFALTLLGRFTIGRTKVEKPYLVFLLVMSLVFYASFIPRYLLLLLFTTGVDYAVGFWIFESPSPARKKMYLVLSLTANLGLLGFYKYSNFVLKLAGDLGAGLGMEVSALPHLALVLPLGISFFTFQSMSYTIDVYRGRLKPVNSYWRFLLFVSFFTHLISGPIVRASELLYQFDRKRRIRLSVFLHGIYLMVLGFFLKMVVADNLAAYVNKYWDRGAADQMPASVPLALAFLFSCQIFADFFGYTNIAMGGAYLLGFKLPVNFDHPYLAASFREFWARWHITLSRWFRDYVYIPLGGNRGSREKVYGALLLTMLLAGLWHGAAYTFLIWGALHGVALILERVLGFHISDGARHRFLGFLWFLVVQATVMVAWIFFRAENAGQGFIFLKNMTGGNFAWKYLLQIYPAFLFASPVLFLHLRAFLVEKAWMGKAGIGEKTALCSLMLYGIITLYGKNNAFLYFQF